MPQSFFGFDRICLELMPVPVVMSVARLQAEMERSYSLTVHQQLRKTPAPNVLAAAAGFGLQTISTSSSMQQPAPRVLVTGGSGYLGQFLVARLLSAGCSVGYTFHSNALPEQQALHAFCVDLASGRGLDAAVLHFQPSVVVNCAALSQPAACERDYAACCALNVPTQLLRTLAALQQQGGVEALLVHVSTDQVYDGSRPWWSEACPTCPINAYGRSKLAAEQAVAAGWPGRHVVLRASLIFGPEPPLARVERPLFVQFVEQALAQGRETSFFVDEFRCAIYVQDICDIVQLIIERHARLPHNVYNMGGPERLSRHDMAVAVAQHCGHSTAPIKAANTADVARGYESPPDISMRMERLLADMPGVRLTPFAEALAAIFPRRCQIASARADACNGGCRDA